METNEISIHQLKIFDFVKSAQKWVTMRDIMAATGSKRETVGQHCRRFVKLGVFDQAEVWPGHRFRLSPMADKRNTAIIKRLDAARDCFGDIAS